MAGGRARTGMDGNEWAWEVGSVHVQNARRKQGMSGRFMECL